MLLLAEQRLEGVRLTLRHPDLKNAPFRRAVRRAFPSPDPRHGLSCASAFLSNRGIRQTHPGEPPDVLLRLVRKALWHITATSERTLHKCHT